jgi:predicted dienelactone hydrolase
MNKPYIYTQNSRDNQGQERTYIAIARMLPTLESGASKTKKITTPDLHQHPNYPPGSLNMAYIPTYHNVTVNNVDVHYFTAGSASLPTLLLLHGFPSSSTQFHDLAPLISHKYHIVALDFPGYGLTMAPADFAYTFENLASVTIAFLAALQISSYAIYVFGKC